MLMPIKLTKTVPIRCDGTQSYLMILVGSRPNKLVWWIFPTKNTHKKKFDIKVNI